MRLFLLFLIPLFLPFLSADTEKDPSLIAVFETFPSSFVNNVNVITGTYHDCESDIVIPGRNH